MALPYQTLHVVANHHALSLERQDEAVLLLEPQSMKYLRDNTKALISTAVDIVDNLEANVLVADMPGVTHADVKVQLKNPNLLVISGTRKREEASAKAKYIHMERNSGTFLHMFTMSTFCDQEKISATYVNGVLTGIVPKVLATQNSNPRTIAITTRGKGNSMPPELQ